MPINSRAKGIRGELAFCKLCKEHGFDDVRRTQQFCGNTGQAADVVGLPYLHVECKYVEKLNLREAMRQAVRDSKNEGKGNIPIVAHKKNGRPWLVTMTADSFFEFYEAYLEWQGEYKDELDDLAQEEAMDSIDHWARKQLLKCGTNGGRSKQLERNKE